MKKCRPVVKEPSGGTLLFRCALPARGASLLPLPAAHGGCLCLGAGCTGCIPLPKPSAPSLTVFASALPARGASWPKPCAGWRKHLCLGAACTGCIVLVGVGLLVGRLCLGAACTGCIFAQLLQTMTNINFASALPARGASMLRLLDKGRGMLCLGAACTGCIIEYLP